MLTTKLVWFSLLGLALGGCGAQVLRYRATDTTPSTTSAPARADAGTLHIIVAQSLGCVMYTPGTTPPLRCFDLHGSTDEEYKSEVEAATKQPNVVRGYYIPDHGVALAAALKSQLANRYSSITVGFIGHDTQPGVVVQSEFGVGDKLVGVTLHAKLPSGAEVTGNGTVVPEHDLSYLAWTIPVTILLLPTSAFWMPPIIDSIRDSQVEAVVGTALRSAVTNLAVQLP